MHVREPRPAFSVTLLITNRTHLDDENASPGVRWPGDCFPRSAYARFNYRLQGERMEPQDQERMVGRTSKWASLAEQVAKLKDGESIVLEPESDPTDDACLTQQACKIRSGLNGIRVSRTVRRAVQVVNGKIVITRIGSWPMLSAFKYTTTQMPNRK